MQLKRAFQWTVATTVLVAQAWVALGERAAAGQAYVVSEQFGGNIWRIADINGDADALDIGERTLWASGFTGARGMEFDGTAVYVVEEGLMDGNNQVVRLSDLNGDGDALDIGERALWLDGLDNPRDVARDASGDWFVSEFDNNQVWRLVDSNNDGDVLDIGEKTLFAEAISGPQMLLPQDGALIVAADVGDQIHRLVDINLDGDALDIGENLPITSNFDAISGLMDGGQGGFFFSSFSTDIVYHAEDRNADGDMFDVAEVLSHADAFFISIDGPWGMAPADEGGFLLADSNLDQLKLVRDINGDGDALDLGEVVVFATGIDAPVDIVTLTAGLPGDFNGDGLVDGADYVVWRKGFGTIYTQADYDDWRAHFGQTAPGGGSGSAISPAVATAVPESASLILWLLSAGLLLARYRK